MGRSRIAVSAVLVMLILIATVATPAQAKYVSIERAKRAIATKAYLVNGAHAVAYGARSCHRIDASRVSCQGYVEKASGRKTTTCTDRMTAVGGVGGVRVEGAAPPAKWSCSG